MNLKELPIYVSDFPKMIKGNYLYIDKTQYIYNLFNGDTQYYFLSRPRRFGKSLLVSTLKELFLGNKKLFKDLWIYSSDYDWQEYPVIRLDFSEIGHIIACELRENLNNELNKIAKKYDVILEYNKTPESSLKELIENLAKINKVVILIDEYDKPILDHISDIEEAKAQREILKSFYSVIKAQDANLRAVFLTGVSRFSKTSIFSGINNLNDITLDPKAAELLGYTQTELSEYFMPYIKNLAKCKGMSIEALMQELKSWYDGYRFSKKDIKIYNPFSVLYAFTKNELVNYWFESGTPSFLIHLISKYYYLLENINSVELDSDSLGDFDIENIPLLALLFQSGYLTIAGYDEKTENFKLKFPNYEVEKSFTKFLVLAMAKSTKEVVSNLAAQLLNALEDNNIAEFCSKLEILFSHIPYTILSSVKENYYHALFQFLLTLLSIESQSEILTNVGRIDLVAQTKTNIYIFEFKLNKSAQIALQQIKDKKYHQKYLDKDKKITLVGINFVNTKDKTELDFIAEDI